MGSSLDLLYVLQPIVIIAATTGLLAFYYRRRLLTAPVLSISLLAYVLAIGGKVVFQLVVPAPTGTWAAGAYYGGQTAVLEVGLAYLFARYSIERRGLRIDNAPAYGAALAFWENGFLLGLLSLPGLLVVVGAGGDGLPAGSFGQVATLVALGTLERVSSVLAHFSWGILVVVAAATRQVRYLAVAVPMGLVDFLVPFAPGLGLVEFEGLIFLLSVLCLLVTYLLTKDEWPSFWGGTPAPPPAVPYRYLASPVPPPVAPPVPTAGSPGEDRSQCPTCGAVFEAPSSLFLPHLGSLVLRKCPACGRRSFMPSHVEAPVTWPGRNPPLR